MKPAALNVYETILFRQGKRRWFFKIKSNMIFGGAQIVYPKRYRGKNISFNADVYKRIEKIDGISLFDPKKKVYVRNIGKWKNANS
jgi:hypothetical protein